jgi:predicted Rossmann fold flavoprotein
MNLDYSVIVIGAGAAGLMCAITAAQRGKKVLILDHANKVGKKILMSGGGRCNFTNYSIEPENYLSDNPHFCKSALSRYNQWQFIELVEKYQIDYYDKGLGQLFCKNSSKDIRDLLLNECQEYSVDIRLKTSILKINKNSDAKTFSVKTDSQDYQCSSLVIATGGLSIPTMGATGFGYQIAEQFGHKIKPTAPALSPLTFEKRWLQKTESLPGNSLDVLVSCNGQSFREALLFTHKGLSGPAILQISSYWTAGLPIVLNVLPHLDVRHWLNENKRNRSEIQLKTLLSNEFSQSLASFFCNEFDWHFKLKQIDEPTMERIIKTLTEWTIFPSGLEGYRVAEVTIGGIDTDQISSKSFESGLCDNLFFIGEVLDVTGHLGGYNFQWAWASGFAAGKYV